MAIGEIKILKFIDGMDIVAEETFFSDVAIGDQSVDGSYRVIIDSGELKTQKRITGAWVTLSSALE